MNDRFLRACRRAVGLVTKGSTVRVDEPAGPREVHAAAFPISIDAAGLAEIARRDDVRKRSREICDALGTEHWRRRITRSRPLRPLPEAELPFVSLHVPAHNEPPDMVIDTLRSLLRLDYPRYEVILIDGNTQPMDDDEIVEFIRAESIGLVGIGAMTRMIAKAYRVADAIRAADGVIFVTPEYNFGIPGPLKNAIDWVSRLQNQPFAGKPIAIQSASPGPVGGARVQYDLRKMMVFLDAFTLNKPEGFVANCASRIDEKTGKVTDEATRGFIKQQLEAFATFIDRHGRKG